MHWKMLAFLLTALAFSATRASASYVAAVAEHTVFQGKDGDSSDYLLNVNLEIYRNLTNLAAQHGVEVLVFPEFGLTPGNMDKRSDLYPYAEVIPSIDSQNLITPCKNSYFSDRPILSQMSCAAQENHLPLLVSMVDWVDCEVTTDKNCPSDNHYQYNSVVVFDEFGRLATKYHKSHEFPSLQSAYDQPLTPSQVTFKSSFGVEFGIFICFDIMFEDPPKVLRERGIVHFLYAVSQGKLGEQTIIEPWSKNNEAVVLSANLGSGSKDCSGIIVNGNALPAAKYNLKDSAFPDENILVATVTA